MSSYLLDTNHVSPLVTFGHPLRDAVLQRLDEGDAFAICVPVITESLFGIGILPRAIQNRAEWKRLRPRMTCYIPDETDAETAAELQLSLRRRGWQLEALDALVAVTALRHQLILLITDGDFQAVPNLQRENWLEQKRR